MRNLILFVQIVVELSKLFSKNILIKKTWEKTSENVLLVHIFTNYVIKRTAGRKKK